MPDRSEKRRLNQLTDRHGIDRPCPQLDDWLCLAEADASVPTSASCYHVEEDIRVVAINDTIVRATRSTPAAFASSRPNF
jgi:hypothetical protein